MHCSKQKFMVDNILTNRTFTFDHISRVPTKTITPYTPANTITFQSVLANTIILPFMPAKIITPKIFTAKKLLLNVVTKTTILGFVRAKIITSNLFAADIISFQCVVVKTIILVFVPGKTLTPNKAWWIKLININICWSYLYSFFVTLIIAIINYWLLYLILVKIVTRTP